MIRAIRFRHATEHERRYGQGMMKARDISYDLEKSEVLARLEQAVRQGDDQIRPNDLASVDAGGIREVTLRRVFTERELEKAFVGAEPDPEGQRELLMKSARQLDALTNAERVRR